MGWEFMKWTINELHGGMLIRDYLQELNGFSRRLLKDVKFDGGEITVNNIPQTVRYQLMVGDLLEVQFPPEKIGPSMHPENIDLPIVYEDDSIIVIDKPTGMPQSRHLIIQWEQLRTGYWGIM